MAYSRLRRSSDQRKALLRDLVTDLILNGRIETTETKARELKRLADKMVTLGKANTLHSRRQAATLIRFEQMVSMQFRSYLAKLPLSLLAVMEVTHV